MAASELSFGKGPRRGGNTGYPRGTSGKPPTLPTPTTPHPTTPKRTHRKPRPPNTNAALRRRLCPSSLVYATKGDKPKPACTLTAARHPLSSAYRGQTRGPGQRLFGRTHVPNASPALGLGYARGPCILLVDTCYANGRSRYLTVGMDPLPPPYRGLTRVNRPSADVHATLSWH